MLSVNFYLKEPKSVKDTPIILRLSYSGKQLKYYISEKINPLLWDSNKQRLIKSKSMLGHAEFNSRLDYIEANAKEVFRRYKNDKLVEPNTSVLKGLLDTAFNKTVVDRPDFWNYLDSLICRSQNGTRTHGRTGKRIHLNTIKTYKTTRSHLSNFQKFRKQKIDFDLIDYNFYTSFVEYLTKMAGCSVNTVGKQIANLKTILSEAFDDGVHNNTFFKNKKFITTREEVDNIYLTPLELKAIFDLQLSDQPRLDKVRDMFVVGCCTGLRFSDYSNLCSEHVKDGYITVKTQKTDATVVIPIHPYVQQVLNKYNGSFPNGISNQKTNDYLKEIARQVPELRAKVTLRITKGGEQVEISKEKWELVTSHTARRTFATTQYLNKFPTLSIMQITGHTTEKSFRKYIKVTPRQHAELLAQHWDAQKITNND